MGRTLVSNQAAPGKKRSAQLRNAGTVVSGGSQQVFTMGNLGSPWDTWAIELIKLVDGLILQRFLSRVFDFEGRNAQEAFLFRYESGLQRGHPTLDYVNQILLVFAESEPNHPFFSCRFKFQHPNRLRVVGLARQRLHWRGFPPIERWPRNGCSACFFSV